MTLNGEMAVILRYSTEFRSFGVNYVKMVAVAKLLVSVFVMQRFSLQIHVMMTITTLLHICSFFQCKTDLSRVWIVVTS